MSTHTPEPWAVRGSQHHGAWLVIGPNDPTFDARPSVADVYQSKADASLISAAPDLLAVARMAVELERLRPDLQSPIFRAAKAAISKATGEAS